MPFIWVSKRSQQFSVWKPSTVKLLYLHFTVNKSALFLEKYHILFFKHILTYFNYGGNYFSKAHHHLILSMSPVLKEESFCHEKVISELADFCVTKCCRYLLPSQMQVYVCISRALSSHLHSYQDSHNLAKLCKWWGTL